MHGAIFIVKIRNIRIVEDNSHDLRRFNFRLKLIFGQRYKKIQLPCVAYPWTYDQQPIIEFEYRTKYPHLLNQQYLTFYLKRQRTWLPNTELGKAQISLLDLCQSDGAHQLPFQLHESHIWPIMVHFECEFIQFFPHVKLGFKYLQFEYTPNSHSWLAEFCKHAESAQVSLCWYKYGEYESNSQPAHLQILHQWDAKEIQKLVLNQTWVVSDVLASDLAKSGLLIHVRSRDQTMLGYVSCVDISQAKPFAVKLFFYDPKTRQSEFLLAHLHECHLDTSSPLIADFSYDINPDLIQLTKTLVKPDYMIDIFFRLNHICEPQEPLWPKLLKQKSQWNEFIQSKITS